jgi:ComF family protein
MLIDWLYPPACVACGCLLPLNEIRRFICVRCENIFEPIAAPFCEKCGAPIESDAKHCASCYGKNFYFESNRSAFTYDELVRDLLHEMKFREKKRVAQGLAFLWASLAQENFSDFTLIPMPLHKKKQRERGFNQAEILAKALSDAMKIPMEKILHRTVDTPPQSGLHPSQRAENVKNVFSVCEKFDVRERSFILIDDIFTTGASLNECAKTLKNAGASQVLCMTLAISVKNNHKS